MYYDEYNDCIIKYDDSDGLLTLESSDDAATSNWGGSWRTPTLEQWQELVNNTTGKRMKQNGVRGFRFSAANGNSIFLPGAGEYLFGNDWNIQNPDCPMGNYMSSSRFVENYREAWYFRFGSIINISYFERSTTGVTIRPVLFPERSLRCGNGHF